MRKQTIWMSLALAASLLLSQAALAAGMWEEGRHYKELPYPAKTRDASKIEVAEVFWYGCPHCYEFANDHLPAWEANLPADVNFVLIPATFPNWIEHAKAFFAAEALGVVDKVHKPLFDAIQVNPKKYNDPDDFKEIFAKHGVSEEDYDAVFKASGFRKISKVDEAIKRTDELMRTYRLTGVPAMIVNGKYFVGVQGAGGFANMLKIVNYLVDKERKNMATKAK